MRCHDHCDAVAEASVIEILTAGASMLGHGFVSEANDMDDSCSETRYSNVTTLVVVVWSCFGGNLTCQGNAFEGAGVS